MLFIVDSKSITCMLILALTSPQQQSNTSSIAAPQPHQLYSINPLSLTHHMLKEAARMYSVKLKLKMQNVNLILTLALT